MHTYDGTRFNLQEISLSSLTNFLFDSGRTTPGTHHGGDGRSGRQVAQGVYCAHPLGGCRMAESADLGVVDDRGEVYGYERLYCIDSSIVPTSLGVNPSDDLGRE